MEITEFIFRLALAFVLGTLVGAERQFKQKSAGLRTNTLVSIGSASFILLSLSLTDFEGDPSRVAGQIVTGIGFLGAGVIMKTGMSILGLNTAATIWCSAAVGSLCGAGLWLQAIVVTVFIVCTHVLLRPLGNKINSISFSAADSSEALYQLTVGCKEQIENHVRILMLNAFKSEPNLQLRSLKSSDKGNPAYSFLTSEVLANGRNDEVMEKIARMLSLEYGVSEVSWKAIGHENDLAG